MIAQTIQKFYNDLHDAEEAYRGRLTPEEKQKFQECHEFFQRFDTTNLQAAVAQFTEADIDAYVRLIMQFSQICKSHQRQGGPMTVTKTMKDEITRIGKL